MTTLTDYETAVTNLLQAPSSPVALVPTFQLDIYINTARDQVAIEAECVRVLGTLAVSDVGGQQYPFSAINISAAAYAQAPITARLITYQIPGGNGNQRVYSRPWPWFDLYELSNPVPVGSPPRVYAQYGQGENGTLYFNLLDTSYTLNIDTACIPTGLTTGGTELAIPYPWTDAVQFYAAWLALLQLQRPGDADYQLQQYTALMARARRGATPSVLAASYEQQTDPTLANKLGSQPFRSGTDISAGAAGGRTVPTSR